MGIRLFGIDVAAEVAGAIASAGGVLNATLTKVTPGQRTPGMLVQGTNPTRTSYACKGFVSGMEQRFVGTPATGGDTVKQTDAMIVLLGATIGGGAVVPAVGDRVSVMETATRTVTGTVIALLDRDAAAATYTLAART